MTGSTPRKLPQCFAEECSLTGRILKRLTEYVRIPYSFEAGGKTVTDRKAVSLKYIGSWFGIEPAAALPIGLLFTMLSTPVSGILALLRLNPLLKLPDVSRTLRKIGGNNINPAILRLILLFFWILLTAHLVAGGWIFITGNPEHLDPITRYIEAFYWTITTLTTIEYGDITPAGNIQIIYVVFIELLGAGMYGLVIGNIANLITNIDVAKTQYREGLDKINAFLKYRNIPNVAQRKINNYYNYPSQYPPAGTKTYPASICDLRASTNYIRNLSFNVKIQHNGYGRWTLIFLVKITSF